MTSAQILVADLVALLLVGTLAGMAWRGRLSLSWSFTALLAVTAVSNRLVVWWPEVFFTRHFWARKELAFSALQALVVLDLCLALRYWPRARRVAVVVVSFVIVATAIVLVATRPDYEARVLFARANIGVAWAYAALVLVVWWFRLPINPFHHQILIGSALQLSFSGVMMALIGWLGTSMFTYFSALDPAVYAATAGIWFLAAWRPTVARAPDAALSVPS